MAYEMTLAPNVAAAVQRFIATGGNDTQQQVLLAMFGGDHAQMNRAINSFSSGGANYDPEAIAKYSQEAILRARGLLPEQTTPTPTPVAGRQPILTAPSGQFGNLPPVGSPFPTAPQTGQGIGSMPDPGFGNLPPSGTGFTLNPFSNPNWKGGLSGLPQAGAVGGFQGGPKGPSITDLLPGYGLQQNLKGFGIPGFEQNQLAGGGSWAGTTFNPPDPRSAAGNLPLYSPAAQANPATGTGGAPGQTGGIGSYNEGQGQNSAGTVPGSPSSRLSLGTIANAFGLSGMLNNLGLGSPPSGGSDPAPDRTGTVSLGDVHDVTGDVGIGGDGSTGPGGSGDPSPGGGEGGSGDGPMGVRKRSQALSSTTLPVEGNTAAPSGLGGSGFGVGNFQPGFTPAATTGAPAATPGSIQLGPLNPTTGERANPGFHWVSGQGDTWSQVADDATSGNGTKTAAGFQITPAKPWITTPYNQTYSGRPAPYANIHDQLGQAMMGQPVAYPGFAWANPASLAALKGVGPPGGWTQMLGFNPGAASGYNPINPYSPVGGK